MKKFLLWFFGLLFGLPVLAIGGILTLAAFASNNQAYVPAPTPFVVDPSIVAVGAKVGLTAAQLGEVHAQLGSCTQANANACYEDDIQTMFIRPETMADSKLPTVVAHEWLHHVWYRKLDANGRKVVGDSLEVLYNRQDYIGSELRWRLEPYVKAGWVPGTDLFDTELHSIWCTEVADNRMTASSLQYCAKWVPGRNALQNTIY